MNEALALYEAGRYAEALPLAVQAATTLDGQVLLGKILHGLGRYDEAAAVWQQVVGSLEAPGDVAQALSNLALELKYAGRLQEALPIYTAAVAQMRGVADGDPRALATLVNNQGEALRALGRYAEAERASDEALELRRASVGSLHPDYARTLAARALLRKNQGRYADAEALLEEALTIYRATLGEAHPDVADACNTLAGVFVVSGRLAAARELYERVLGLWRQVIGSDQHPHIANALNSLAVVELQLGHVDRAEPLFEDALRIFLRFPPGPLLAATLDTYAQALFANGDFARARDLFAQSLPLWEQAGGPRHPDLAKCLIGLAVCRGKLGPVAETIPMLEQGLEILEAALGPDHPDTTTPRVDLARAGRQEEARALLERGRAVTERALGPDAPELAIVIETLGGIEQTLGHHDAAVALFSRALTLAPAADVPGMLHNLALSHAGAGRPREALEAQLRALALQDASLVRVLATLSNRQRVLFLRQAREDLYALLSLVRASFADDGEVVAAAFDVVLRRKGIAAEALAAERDALLANDDPELRARLDRLRALRAELASRTLAGDPRASALGDERDQLERELARDIPELAQASRLRVVDHVALAAALPEGAALVEIVLSSVFDFHAVPPAWTGYRYLAFVLDAAGAVSLVDLGPGDEVDALLTDYLTPFSRRGAAARHIGVAAALDSDAPDGHALRERVLDPLGPARRLFVSPDGGLARLPLESLPLPGGGWVLDEYEISYLSTGRDLLRHAEPALAAGGPPVVIADPDYDLGLAGGAVTAPRFEPLPGTADEGRQVGLRLGVTAMTGASVLERDVKAVRSPAVLHIATHGFFLADAPERALPLGAPGPENALLRSGLALAGANARLHGVELPPEAEDGILYAEDVTALDLRGTELVVLSACDSGLGDVRAGEGVFGLRRSFALAGADTLVLSLWPVPDIVTQELMEAFYSNLASGHPRDAALRAAQIAIRARHPSVADWGAFVLEGRTGPLSS